MAVYEVGEDYFRLDGQRVTEQEFRDALDADPQVAAQRAIYDARQSLATATELRALSPFPTPEEQAGIDAQVASALAAYRALPDPPADVSALAVAVLTWGS